MRSGTDLRYPGLGDFRYARSDEHQERRTKVSLNHVALGASAVAAAAFVPGAAEAHCGHGMYGYFAFQVQGGIYDDTGCVGKGDPTTEYGPEAAFGLNCLQWWATATTTAYTTC